MALEAGIATCFHCNHTFATEMPKIKDGKIGMMHCPKCEADIELLCCKGCRKLVDVFDSETKLCVECQPVGELELFEHMIERNDIIDNAVHDCLCALAEKDLAWNMQAIAEATEQMKCVLESVYGIRVRHYSVVTDGDKQTLDDGLE